MAIQDRRFDQLDYIACEAARSVPSARRLLFEATMSAPMHRELFEEKISKEVLEERLESWPRILSAMLSSVTLVPVSPFCIWSCPLVLAHYMLRSKHRIIGLAGAPGSGKSTLAALIAQCATALDEKSNVLVVSLDDFYYSKAERKSRGFKFRAQPGCHDLKAALEFLTAVRRGEHLLHVPRFNHAVDDSGFVECFEGPVSILLLEGWFIGMRDHSYRVLAEQIDYLIYIDCPVQLARDHRFEREAYIRRMSDGVLGLSQEAMKEFWEQILEPGIANWVHPVQSFADLVIHLDSAGYVTNVVRN